MWTYNRTRVCNGKVEDFAMRFKMTEAEYKRLDIAFEDKIPLNRKKMENNYACKSEYGHPFSRTLVDGFTAIAIS